MWSLMLSTQLLDVVFLALYPFNIESLEPIAGSTGGYGQLLIHADYTHSLVGALGISLVAALVTMIPWGRRNALIIGAMVFSHWVLDLLVHRGDMPILPGNAGDLPRVGLGLWAIPWLTAAMELVLIVVGAYLYYHASMRAAARTERQEARAGTAPTAANYRQRALVASGALFVIMVGTLAGDLLGIG
jgi:membrane-bound metal-dependent hydrolase YbcI (DUF457 family)